MCPFHRGPLAWPLVACTYLDKEKKRNLPGFSKQILYLLIHPFLEYTKLVSASKPKSLLNWQFLLAPAIVLMVTAIFIDSMGGPSMVAVSWALRECFMWYNSLTIQSGTACWVVQGVGVDWDWVRVGKGHTNYVIICFLVCVALTHNPSKALCS